MDAAVIAIDANAMTPFLVLSPLVTKRIKAMITGNAVREIIMPMKSS